MRSTEQFRRDAEDLSRWTFGDVSADWAQIAESFKGEGKGEDE